MILIMMFAGFFEIVQPGMQSAGITLNRNIERERPDHEWKRVGEKAETKTDMPVARLPYSLQDNELLPRLSP